MNEIITRINNLKTEIKKLISSLNLSRKKERILELEDKMQAPGFWEDNQVAQKIAQEHSQLSSFISLWEDLETETNELIEIAGAADVSESDKTYIEEHITLLEKEYNKNRFVALLSKQYDEHNAIFSIHAGAGGTDAQDWTEMLMRMFLRFCERHGFKTEVIDISRGSEAGIKSVTVQVHGAYAYGLLKSEAGVHRLVRLSPFNPTHTRETSFALLELLPILEEKETGTLDPKDLKIEATTSSGHGGQSVNTTYSAIRITHIPTGLKVSIQNERSQHQNKELAMKILAAKLKALQEEQLAREKKQLRGEFKSAEWGNQIRSYVLHPYKLVKDHRTGIESSNPDEILDGSLDQFIESYLEWSTKQEA
jgi:peptide chain release factor 2